MAEIKWIKIVTDIFNNDKIAIIDSMPEHDAIIVIWFKLLCLAGKQNNNGIISINEFPYTDEMLASVFHRPITTVRLALQTFEKFGMIEKINGFITIPNWERYQAIDKMTEIREYNRIAQQKHRAQLKRNVNDLSMTCQPCQDTDKEADKEADNNNSIAPGARAREGKYDFRYEDIPKAYLDEVLPRIEAANKEAVAMSWWARDKQNWKPTKNGSFDTDEFFNAAVSRSLGTESEDVK